jgi:hypothetical protein
VRDLPAGGHPASAAEECLIGFDQLEGYPSRQHAEDYANADEPKTDNDSERLVDHFHVFPAGRVGWRSNRSVLSNVFVMPVVDPANPAHDSGLSGLYKKMNNGAFYRTPPTRWSSINSLPVKGQISPMLDNFNNQDIIFVNKFIK